MSAPDCRPLLETTPALPDEFVVKSAEILNISAKMKPDGTLRWQAPKGKWEILRIGHIPAGGHVSTHSAGWGGRVIDYLNPAALDDLLETAISSRCARRSGRWRERRCATSTPTVGKAAG